MIKNFKYITQSSDNLFTLHVLSSKVLIKKKSQYTLHAKTQLIEDTLYIV